MATALSAKRKALRMIRGKGANAVTHYSCGVVEQAKKTGVKILVIRRGKEVLRDPRQVHRENLLAVFGDTHEFAGQGKFIDLAAFPKGDQTRVVGAQHVNPYLREDGAYPTIVEALKQDIGMSKLSRLKGKIVYNRDLGPHVLWEGRRNSEGSLVCSNWFTQEELWDRCCKLNPDLIKMLRKSKSGVKGAAHKTAREKFIVNLDVLRRATCEVSAADGERSFRGGATPYSKPLEQVGFAIDKRFLTCGVDENGDEIGQYYYRLVIGRPEPHPLRRVDWKYEGVTSTIAFKDEAARRAVRKAS